MPCLCQPTIILVGQGLIGSFAVGHLARQRDLAQRVVLIDADTYEPANLGSQDIEAGALGLPKAIYQAERLRRLAPHLQVEAVVGRVEHLPLGMLRSRAILAAVDSRRTRDYLGFASWRLGVPLIDAGVAGAALLARVTTFIAGESAPCFACTRDPRFGFLDQVKYSCSGAVDPEGSVPTGAPSSLGGLAAALQALECEKLLRGPLDPSACGRQILIDAAKHQHFVTSYRRNPQCIFDHRVWSEVLAIDWHGGSATLGDLVVEARGGLGEAGPVTMSVFLRPFVTRWSCGCGWSEADFCLLAWLGSPERRCPSCGTPPFVTAFHRFQRISSSCLSARELSRSLKSLGLRPGDVMEVQAGAVHRHIELRDNHA